MKREIFIILLVLTTNFLFAFNHFQLRYSYSPVMSIYGVGDYKEYKESGSLSKKDFVIILNNIEFGYTLTNGNFAIESIEVEDNEWDDNHFTVNGKEVSSVSDPKFSAFFLGLNNYNYESYKPVPIYLGLRLGLGKEEYDTSNSNYSTLGVFLDLLGGYNVSFNQITLGVELGWSGILNGVQSDFCDSKLSMGLSITGNINKNKLMKSISSNVKIVKKKEIIKIDKHKPSIIITDPVLENNLFRTEEFTTIIKGKATDNEGLFQVYVNNEVATLKSNGQFQDRVKLKIGKNPIEIKAVDINDNETTKEFLIIRDEIIEEDEFSDIDFAFETSNKKPNAIAVVFGIEEYQYAPKVTNAYNDAEIMREYLISTFGLKRKNIYFRYNERATKGEFEKVFSENGWVAKNADPKSEIYIFYAGHGVASTDDKSAYLIPNDIDPNYASTGYPLNKLYHNLSKIKSKSTTIILDACFSGISRENEMLLANSRPVSIRVKQGSIPKNLNVFTASSGSEISSGYSQKLHGLFTYFFLKGLNKNADSNNDNKITYGEMENYLKENVSSQAKKMGREQNPQLHTSDKDKILLKY